MKPGTFLAAPALLASLVLAAPLSARAQEQGSAAQARFVAGRGHLDARNYPEALDDFRASLALFPSPNTRLYLARTLREAGRVGEAYREFVRTADEAEARARTEPRYGPTGVAARSEAQGLLPRIATLTLVLDDAPEGTRVRLNGQNLERSQWGVTIASDPGSVSVDAEAPGRAAFRSTVELTAGHAARVQVRLASMLSLGGGGVGFVSPEGGGTTVPPTTVAGPGFVGAGTPPPPTGGGNNVVVVGASGTGPGPGAGVALMITGGVLVLAGSGLGVGALVTYNGLTDECSVVSGVCTVVPTDAEGRAGTGRLMGGLFTAGLVLGASALVTGGVIYAVTGGGRPRSTASAAPGVRGMALTFDPSRDGAMLGLRGAF